MPKVSPWPAVLGFALAMIVVVLIEPRPHSLSYAGGGLVLLALLGWIIEARRVAGPAPAVEPEHEEEEEAPGPSYWPLVLAVGIVAIAAGLVYDWEYGMLIIAVPLAAAAAATWANEIKAEQTQLAAVAAANPPPGTVPVDSRILATQAAAGSAIAIERLEKKEISRRSLVGVTFWLGLGGTLAASVGVMFDFLWPRGITGFGSVMSPGTIDQFPPGTKTPIPQGKFWLVNLTEEQGGPGFLALWWKCPHLGCTVPWVPTFNFVNPNTGEQSTGWFRCPCHGSTYNDAGVRVYGPAPRSMDRMELTIDPGTGRISVNTGSIEKGDVTNADFAVEA
jgi:cytochrome b6-f complex iron-sulfur subunit